MLDRIRIAKEWFDRGEHDLKGAEILFNSGHYTDTIAILIHQAIEKYLKGYVCYIRSKYLLKEINFSNDDFQEAIQLIRDILRIMQYGYYPKKTRYSIKCVDCCYKNICV